ncbi:response regulator transcription factor [Flavobacterium poyangense]|uniref:response regulator transcription factor n=1 Tax=Flavobacterium poyangense TaxID=2204302 RepID=UPI00141F0EE9|nr:helix-turn-helix transcriptional regulator [Flavobacterium sp. JXAS1]
MFELEIILFIIAYTTLSISLTFAFICYKRNMETQETLALIISLLLLIISISVSPLLKRSGHGFFSNLFTISAMVIVGTTTLLNTLKERQHKLRNIVKELCLGLGIAILFIVNVVSFFHITKYAEWLAVGYLIFSILVSMLITRTSEPKIKLNPKTDSDRLFAIVLLVTVPLYLILQFKFCVSCPDPSIGFLLPLLFSIIAINKIIDDVNRLSILKNNTGNLEQNLTGYGLSDRETEVAQLLSQGLSYQSISEQLFISIPTVKTHTSNIYRKCNIKSKYELMKIVFY